MYLVLAYIVMICLILLFITSGCSSDTRRRSYMLNVESSPADSHEEDTVEYPQRYVNAGYVDMTRCPEPEPRIVYKYKYKSKRKSKRK